MPFAYKHKCQPWTHAEDGPRARRGLGPRTHLPCNRPREGHCQLAFIQLPPPSLPPGIGSPTGQIWKRYNLFVTPEGPRTYARTDTPYVVTRWPMFETKRYEPAHFSTFFFFWLPWRPQTLGVCLEKLDLRNIPLCSCPHDNREGSKVRAAPN